MTLETPAASASFWFLALALAALFDPEPFPSAPPGASLTIRQTSAPSKR